MVWDRSSGCRSRLYQLHCCLCLLIRLLMWFMIYYGESHWARPQPQYLPGHGKFGQAGLVCWAIVPHTSNIYEPQFLKLHYPCFSHYYISHFTIELACIIIKKIQFLKLLCLPLLFQLLGATTLLTKHSVNISVVLNKITCHQSIPFSWECKYPPKRHLKLKVPLQEK